VPSQAQAADELPVNRPHKLGSPHHGIPFELYDAFAARRFGGNVAGVVISQTAISPALMQNIASELGAPTTGFAHVRAGQPVIIRYFTPRQEIEACGHATVAVATALVSAGGWPPGNDQVRASTPAGPLRILFQVAPTASAPRRVLVGLAYQPHPLERDNLSRHETEAALAVPTDPGLPVEVVWTGLRHLIVPAGSPDALARLAPSEAALTSLAASCGADTVCVFAKPEPHRVPMRDFCAPIGALEEPASGTTSAALASYLIRHAAITTPAALTVEQGAETGRPSRIEVHVERARGQEVTTVWGSALRTASGMIYPS
jgi:trans-2,3-dihydro-3-hydroxyanthranilate isomerase